MKKFHIFLARVFISLIIATVISLIFFKRIDTFKTPALAAGLLFFSYVFESTRSK